MKKHIYLAGSLFSEAEVAQRLKEGAAIKRELSDTHTYFNPIEAPINDKAKLPTCLDIFMGDTMQVLSSDVVIADLANEDAGVMMELGIAWALDYVAQLMDGMNLSEGQQDFLNECGIKRKSVHTVLSDIRLGTSHLYKADEIPFGYNQYVIGGIKEMEGKVHSSFDSALQTIKEEV